MPYLGRELTSGNYLKLDDISSQFNGSTTTFQLKSGGSDFFPGSSFSLLVSVAGVIQEADSAYQINNNEITFATAPGSSDDCFIIVLGLALGVGVPADGSVGLSQNTFFSTSWPLLNSDFMMSREYAETVYEELLAGYAGVIIGMRSLELGSQISLCSSGPFSLILFNIMGLFPQSQSLYTRKNLLSNRDGEPFGYN